MTTNPTSYLNKIICGDCLEILREMPDKCIDTIITDPVWPDAQAEISGKERAWELFVDAAMHFPRIAKRAVIHLGCDSDPRFLSGLPRSMPFPDGQVVIGRGAIIEAVKIKEAPRKLK